MPADDLTATAVMPAYDLIPAATLAGNTTMGAALADFEGRYPAYAGTAVLDGMRARDYTRLDATGHIYLDYTGGGLYAESQLTRHRELLAGAVFGNPHSQNVPSREWVPGWRRPGLSLIINFSACGFSSWDRSLDGLAHVVAGGRVTVLRSWRPPGSGFAGFWRAGRAGQGLADVAESAADPGRGQAARRAGPLPGQAGRLPGRGRVAAGRSKR